MPVGSLSAYWIEIKYNSLVWIQKVCEVRGDSLVVWNPLLYNRKVCFIHMLVTKHLWMFDYRRLDEYKSCHKKAIVEWYELKLRIACVLSIV